MHTLFINQHHLTYFHVVMYALLRGFIWHEECLYIWQSKQCVQEAFQLLWPYTIYCWPLYKYLAWLFTNSRCPHNGLVVYCWAWTMSVLNSGYQERKKWTCTVGGLVNELSIWCVIMHNCLVWWNCPGFIEVLVLLLLWCGLWWILGGTMAGVIFGMLSDVSSCSGFTGSGWYVLHWNDWLISGVIFS